MASRILDEQFLLLLVYSVFRIPRLEYFHSDESKPGEWSQKLIRCNLDSVLIEDDKAVCDQQQLTSDDDQFSYCYNPESFRVGKRAPGDKLIHDELIDGTKVHSCQCQLLYFGLCYLPCHSFTYVYGRIQCYRLILLSAFKSNTVDVGFISFDRLSMCNIFPYLVYWCMVACGLLICVGTNSTLYCVHYICYRMFNQ